VAVLSAFALSLFFRKPPVESRTVKLSLPPPENAAFLPGNNFALSPSGSHIVFTATVDGTTALWLRALDALDARALPGTEGGIGPFWSPDSQSIGFLAGGKLK